MISFKEWSELKKFGRQYSCEYSLDKVFEAINNAIYNVEDRKYIDKSDALLILNDLKKELEELQYF